MKLLKTLTLMAAFGLSISLTTHAATRTDTWNGNGAFRDGYGVSGLWTSPDQPDFVPAVGGTLYTNADVLGGTNSSSSYTGATLVTGPSAQYGTGGLAGGSLYTFNQSPALTITSNGVLDGVKYIQLTISSTVTGFSSGSVAFDFDGSFSLISFNEHALGPVVVPVMGALEAYQANWIFAVDANVDPADFTLSWTTPGAHRAYIDITLTQSVEAIPEPSTWALLGVGLVAAVWISRRRKATLSVGQ